MYKDRENSARFSDCWKVLHNKVHRKPGADCNYFLFPSHNDLVKSPVQFSVSLLYEQVSVPYSTSHILPHTPTHPSSTTYHHPIPPDDLQKVHFSLFSS